MKEYEYSIRAHHGMCLAFFEGKGYSREFSGHMAKIKRILERNPRVCVTSRTDAICQECPNHNQGICTSDEKVVRYDREVLSRCGLSGEEVMPFRDFERLVYGNILLPGKREEIRGDCQWSALCHFKQ